MDRFIFYTFYFLVAARSFGSTVVAESAEPYSLPVTLVPSNLSETYSELTNSTEDSKGPIDSSYNGTVLPYFLSERPTSEESFTSKARKTLEEDPSTLNVTFANDTPEGSIDLSLGSDNRQETSTRNVDPSPKLNRVMREEEIDDALEADDMREEGLIETDFLSDVPTSVDPIDRTTSDSKDSSWTDGVVNDRNPGKVVFVSQNRIPEDDGVDRNSANDLEDPDDAYGAVYPYLNHRQHLQQDYWSRYGRRLYPIFPGR